MNITRIPFDDPDEEAKQLSFEEAIAAEEARGFEILRRIERERELASVGDADIWP